MPRSLITDETSYLAWHQMEADEDVDGDGLGALSEFRFGTDASEADFVNAEFVSYDPLVIGIQRNGLATDFWPPLFDSFNLVDWNPVTPINMTSELLDADLDRLLYEVELDPDATRRFFSFETDE